MLDRTRRLGHFDFETRSTVDLRKKGLHLYAEHPDTGIWCACYAIDDGSIETWLPGRPCPQAVLDLVATGGDLWAHNASFERMIWKHILTPRYGWPTPLFNQWHCTMAAAFAMALPGSLESAAAALGLEGKDSDGYAMMMRMARPRRIDNGRPVWWDDDPERLRKLVAYCRKDVEVERALHGRLNELRAQERQVWLLDQMINDRGVLIDQPLCKTARTLVEAELKVLNAEIVEVSDRSISTTNTVAQISAYCRDQGVADVESIAADAVEELLAREDLPPKVRRVLEIRAEASLSSVKKIETLLNGACADGRVRGLLQYHAASTGRWAGRRFQPQNLKRPVNHNQDQLIELINTGKASIIRALGGSILEVISDVLRGLIVAAPGQAEAPATAGKFGVWTALSGAGSSVLGPSGPTSVRQGNQRIHAFHHTSVSKCIDIYSKAHDFALRKLDNRRARIGRPVVDEVRIVGLDDAGGEDHVGHEAVPLEIGGRLEDRCGRATEDLRRVVAGRAAARRSSTCPPRRAGSAGGCRGRSRASRRRRAPAASRRRRGRSPTRRRRRADSRAGPSGSGPATARPTSRGGRTASPRSGDEARHTLHRSAPGTTPRPCSRGRR